MKNKKNIYFLLPAVLIIWGLLGYKIFSSVSPKELPQEKYVHTELKLKEIKESEKFTIDGNYRDPFLGTIKRNTTRVKTTAKKTVKTAAKPFPNIVYKGLMASQLKNGEVFFIEVGGKQFSFKKNAVHQEVKLIRGSSKKVLLEFEGNRQVFVLAK